ncbi:tryptophan aminotransferase-related protein 1 [Beta vulgaris subsp. vulgaris]|uniref:tryptophan aminotransferase-related protein 1 n=1 Tax=Beta vulgaris subsp. vulgaris TaxID=3555 RepID=UPI0020374082|nr:tryptophan aminotransferase-related protein 1 [Beta vulgaris subsp. vulgaris]
MCLTEGKQKANIANGNVNCNGNGVKSNGYNNHSSSNNDVVISLDRGDPKIYYTYWKKMDDKCKVTIKASELMSYFGDYDEGGVFYQLPEFSNAVHRMHRIVGNAVTEGRYIIGGTGSSQLFTVALRALASTVNATTNNSVLKKKHIPVVCAQPYYSCYEEALQEEKSEVYKWRGDANSFEGEGPYIEVVTTPNNPDGRLREPVVKKEGGMVICDLAYYWPQYTPITAAADYDIMLFTLSKATGHAGSRVGWAIVKDKEIAARMIKLMSLITIGTCHEGQLRATTILDFIADSYEAHLPNGKLEVSKPLEEGFFEFSHHLLADRWKKLRAAVNRCGAFNLPDYSAEYCDFMNKTTHPNPAYAWMELKSGEDAEKLMNELKIRTRAGPKFGVSSKYVRVSMLESDDTFNQFLERLSTLLCA